MVEKTHTQYKMSVNTKAPFSVAPLNYVHIQQRKENRALPN